MELYIQVASEQVQEYKGGTGRQAGDFSVECLRVHLATTGTGDYLATGDWLATRDWRLATF